MSLLLTRSDVASLLGLDECIAAVETAFRALGAGAAPTPVALGHHVPGGAFHLKAASLDLGRRYFAAKANGNFFGNDRLGLPRIQGVIVLCDAERGTPLAVMDSIEITILRTAAATAVAARYLAPDAAPVVTIAGCGVQGRAHVRALARVRDVREFRLVDTAPAAARALAADLAREVPAALVPADSLRDATQSSDIVVTCTPARAAILHSGDVRPGAFVAAVGADSEDKQELAPALMASSAVVVDVLEQCATFGDLAHAIADGAMTRASVHATLGEIVAGTRPDPRAGGRTVVFDSTGTAIQDVAAAAVVYERAVARNAGTPIALNA